MLNHWAICRCTAGLKPTVAFTEEGVRPAREMTPLKSPATTAAMPKQCPPAMPADTASIHCATAGLRTQSVPEP